MFPQSWLRFLQLLYSNILYLSFDMEFIFLLTVRIDDVINGLVLRSTHLSKIWLKSNLESR